MKKGLFTFLLFVCSSQLFFAQKVTVKKDLVSIDETPVFTIVSTSYPNAYTLYNLNNEKLAYFFAQFYSDPRHINNANPQGKVSYFDITFFNEAMDKCEIRIVGFKKHLAELIISEGLVKEGKLDEAAVKQFCRINGTKFSEDRKNAGTTVIIKN
jgi:hypothetical protein